MEDENAVAVVGLGCRFPGAEDADEFWKLLENGECHIKPVPPDRFDLNDTDMKDTDKSSWKPSGIFAALIDEHDKWDNKFFDVSDLEASWMNPQQCLALEVTHSALENGGFTKTRMKGTNTGVYMGVMNDDLLMGLHNARDEFNNLLVTGIAPSLTANRISYTYDLRGPSITLDTACSSAMVSVHYGCQAIRTGECDMAICGGVNSILSPLNFVALGKANMISPTGKSHAFSQDADGYVRGEGCGIVILKKYQKAKEDGDLIYGLVATGCNQDGHTSTPITAPSAKQQLSLLQMVYSQYQINPGQVQHIEAHGTGTPVGDPIEVKALANFFSSHLNKNMTISIGSVKTNIGHLESSAGTAGLIKSILMMKNGKIVPTLHYEQGKGNSHIDFENIPLQVAISPIVWPSHPEGHRICCVNSFGFGGTNCHAVLKQIQDKNLKPKDPKDDYVVVCISGKSIPAVKKTALHLRQKISNYTYSASDIAYTSLLKRDQFTFRMTYVVSNCSELAKEIDNTQNNIQHLVAVDSKIPNTIFLFCGVGTMWKGTCSEILNNNLTFRTKFIEVDKELQKHANLSILQEVQKPSDDLANDPLKGPLIIFACQVALFHTWADLGVRPDIIIGQSVGEVAAAYAAGCLNFEDAVKVIYHRSRLSANARGGRMMVISKCDVNEIEKICEKYSNKLCVAVYSSEEACAVSGDKSCIEKLQTEIKKSMTHVQLKKLDVGCAYHSFHMDEVCTAVQKSLKGLMGEKPIVTIISTVTAVPVLDKSMSSPIYWTKNIRNPVLLKEAVLKAVVDDKPNVILELGPKPVIKTHLKNITSKKVTSIASLNQTNEPKVFKYAIAELHQLGYNINWTKIFEGHYNLTDIPRYKFNRTGILMESNALREGLKIKHKRRDSHPFIKGKPLTKECFVTVSTSTMPYVYEHFVDNRNIAPGAIHVEIAYELGKQTMKLPNAFIDISLEFVRPLNIGKAQTIILETMHTESEYAFEVRKREDVICKVNVRKARKSELERVSISTLKQACQTHKTAKEFYDMLKQLGFQYGDCLRVIHDSWISDTLYVAEMELQHDFCKDYHQLNLHPIALDGALQTVALFYFPMQDKDSTKIEEKPIPIRIKSLIAHRPLEKKMIILGKLVKSNSAMSIVDIMIVNDIGDVLVEIEGFEVKNIAFGVSKKSLSDKLYKLRWHPNELQDVKRESDKQTMFIVFSPEASLVLEKYMAVSKEYISCLPFQTDNYNAKIMYQELQSFMSTVFKGIGYIEKIVFFPGLTCFSENQDSEVVFNMVKTSCVILTELIKQLLRDNIDIPVYILTKQTQPKSDIDLVENGSFNVVGSELWGIGRCLARERTFSRLYLIDFENDEDTNLVHGIMSDSKSEGWKQPREYKLEKNSVFINQITKASVEHPHFRMTSYNEKDTVDIRTRNPLTADQLFMVPSSHTLKTPKSISFLVEDILINDIWTPLTKTKATEDPDPWKYRRQDGHHILPCEMTGYISQSTSSFITKSTSAVNTSRVSAADCSRKKFGTCFPQSCSNVLVLSDDCILDVSLFPEYTPGMLSEAVMYFSLFSNFNDKLPSVILFDEDLHLNLSELRSIIKFTKRKLITIVEIAKFAECSFPSYYQVVLLSKNVSKIETLLKTDTCHIDKIISFTSFVTKSIERQTRYSHPNLQLQLINTDEVGNCRTLPKYLEMVKLWLVSKTTKLHWEYKEKCFAHGEYLITFAKDVKNKKHIINAHILHKATTTDCLFSRNATYVIVGGLTGLGWETVHTIAKMGGGGIAILSRRTPNEEKQSEINNLMAEYNCKIEHTSADISDLLSVKQAFITIDAKFPNQIVKGIFHGATVVQDSIILKMTEDMIDMVLRPKVLGTWNLHLASKHLKLDYFVLHSSVSSAFGNSGQTNYGAGNSFKDTVAYFRRSIGLAGQTINWGPFNFGLLENNKAVEKRLNDQGYNSLEKPEVIECFLHTLTANSVQEIWGLFDWEKIIGHAADMVHLTSRLNPILDKLNLNEVLTSHKNKISYVYHEDLLKLNQKDQHKTIMNIIQLLVADVCALDATLVEPSTKFGLIGMDSMKGMSFIDAVYEHVSCRIPVGSVIDGDSSVESVTALILEQINAGSERVGYMHVKKPKQENKDEDHLRHPHSVSSFQTEITDIDYKYFQVLKETTKGKDRQVKLWIANENGVTFINWSRENGEKHLPLDTQHNFELCSENGMKVLSFETPHGKIRFKNQDKELMDTIWRELEGKVKSWDTHL